MDDKSRIVLILTLIVLSLLTFMYSWFSVRNDSFIWINYLSSLEQYFPKPKDSNTFNQYFILGCIMLFGASFHLQKLGAKNSNE